MTRSDFAALLERMNSETPRRVPGQVSPMVCEMCLDGGEQARVVNAVIAWEVRTKRAPDGSHTGPGRFATPSDMEAVASIARACAATMAGEMEAA